MGALKELSMERGEGGRQGRGDGSNRGGFREGRKVVECKRGGNAAQSGREEG